MKDFIEIIKENAKNYPERIAVIDNQRKITYSDFISLVNSISNYLISVKSKPSVVIDLNQGAESYALIVAILNIGGTYCPLNPEAPIERKHQIILEFNPDLIVADSNEIKNTLEIKNVINIKQVSEFKNSSNIEFEYEGDDIIYVIYTSGSTGISKGVKICRKALNKFLEWSIPTYSADENDIWGQFSFLSFDLSIVDIFTCLCSGSTLYSMNNLSAKKYRPSNVIEKEQITIWHSIPSAVEFMMKNEKSKNFDFSSLRLLSFCGETLYKHQVEFLFSKNLNIKIFNTYGPTEGTLFCTWQELTSANYLKYSKFSMSIGKPIPGWYINLKSVDEIEGKEIVLYGEYIGKGYLGYVEDSKFKLLKISNEEVECFETGDIVIEENDNLFFSERIDRQVQLKGNRIELDEIDLRIREFLSLPCITIVKKETLYSFIETHEEFDDTELRGFLKTKLELYKIPNAFYPIEEIPRTPNQKVDFKLLLEKIP